MSVLTQGDPPHRKSPVIPPRLFPHTNVVAKRLGKEMVLVHLETNRIYELNVTAARLWELLGKGSDLTSIQTQMQQEFDVNEEQLEAEIKVLLSVLIDKQLVSAEAPS